jgi:hypothetical protein
MTEFIIQSSLVQYVLWSKSFVPFLFLGLNRDSITWFLQPNWEHWQVTVGPLSVNVIYLFFSDFTKSDLSFVRTSFRRNHHTFVNQNRKPSVAKEMSHFLVSSLNLLATYRLTFWDVVSFITSIDSKLEYQAGVNFASVHNLRLAVKASGHDLLGRSTAKKNSLLISTHKF